MKKPEKFTVKARKSVIQVFNVIIALKEERKTAVLLKVMIRNCLPIIIRVGQYSSKLKFSLSSGIFSEVKNI